MRQALHILLPVLLISPLLILLGQVSLDVNSLVNSSNEWLGVIGAATLQSSLSASLSVLLGGCMAIGLLSVNSLRALRVWQGFALFPAILPPIVATTFVMFFSDQLGTSFQGLWAIVTTHALINSGLCALLFVSRVQSNLIGQLQAAKVMGASDLKLVANIILPQSGSAVLAAFFLVFGFCMISFVAPLLLAPGEYWSLEVYIFRALRVSYDFQLACVASLVQLVLVSLVVFFLMPKTVEGSSWREASSETVLSFRFLLLIPLVIALIFALGAVLEFRLLGEIFRESGGLFWQEWVAAATFSAQVTVISLLASALFLLLLLYAFPRQRLHRFILACVPLSPVVLGFSFWSLGFNEKPMDLLKIALAITLLYLPAFYRWKIAGLVESLRGQVAVARSMGASDWQIFAQVVLPQSREVLLFVLTMMSLWASGDFVMTSILTFSKGSLPMLAETLTTSYRLGLAAFTSLSILGMGGVFAGLVWVLMSSLWSVGKKEESIVSS